MRVGTRTTAAAALLLVMTGAAWRAGRLRVDRLVGLDPWAMFAVGALSALAVAAVFRLWRLWRVAEAVPVRLRADSFGRHLKPFELHPHLLALVYLVAFLQMGLLAFNHRAVARLRALPSVLGRVGSDYCHPEKPAVVEEDPLKHGCQLMLRAYALGYAKSLGACAPKEKQQEEAPCDLRQLDEPYLHYEWRVWLKNTSWVERATARGQRDEAFTRFSQGSKHTGTLLRVEADAVGAEARASHHLFTNLPNPQLGLIKGSASKLGSPGCEDVIGVFEPFSAVADEVFGPSLALEHVVTQLLFNPAYKPSVGQCRELTIHWDSPDDTCAKLAKDPKAVLTNFNSLKSVNEVIARRERTIMVRKLRPETAVGRADVKAAENIVSFQCLMASKVKLANGAALKERALTLAGTPFVARELSVPTLSAAAQGQLELYKWAAQLFSPGFAYGRLMSREAAGQEGEDEAARKSLSEEGYILSKLQALREVDVLLGHEWLQGRPDLLEVYPYHLHLTNLIEVFRERYQLQRGRL